jgi:hypothetical protein
MSLRIDLMREDEHRYQGPVSRKFIGVAIGAFLGAILLLVLGLILQRNASTRRELAQAENDWSTLGPRYAEARVKRASFSMCQSYQAELKQWADTRMDWAARLDELQTLIPDSIQLTRIGVRCEWSVIKAPAATVAASEKAEGAEKKPAPPPDGVPARRYQLSISGRAAGESGGDLALGIVTKLKLVPGYGTNFETIKLQNVLRDSVANDQADRSFSIEGVTTPRKLE